jgi:hypothetical protein
VENRLVRYGSIAVALVIAVAFAGIGKYVGRKAADSYFDDKSSASIERAQEVAAKELRKQLPLKVDSVTTLQSVLSFKKTIIYSYIIDIDFDQIDSSDFIREVSKHVIYNACSTKEMKEMIYLGGSYRYSYMSKDGFKIGELSVERKDCP